MNPLISVFTNTGHEVLINIDSIAVVWPQQNGITVIKLKTFTSASTHDEIFTREAVAAINAKVKAALG